ncbi:MAG: hypothetical protein RR995_06700, partial [Hungatella sp.]
NEIVADLKLQHTLTQENVMLPLHSSEMRDVADGQLSMIGAGRTSVIEQLAAVRPTEKSIPAQGASKKTPIPEI